MFPQNELAETILLSTYGRKNLFKKTVSHYTKMFALKFELQRKSL